MYCGSCLRDNTLATELLARGHDVVLLPVYTPTRTDEENVSDSRVFFSGTMLHKQGKHLLHIAAFRASRVQLTIGISTGTSFTKTII